MLDVVLDLVALVLGGMLAVAVAYVMELRKCRSREWSMSVQELCPAAPPTPVPPAPPIGLQIQQPAASALDRVDRKENVVSHVT